MIKEYCQKLEYLPFIDTAFTEIKPLFSKEKISHGCCRLDPEFAIKHNENKIDNPSQWLEEELHLFASINILLW